MEKLLGDPSSPWAFRWLILLHCNPPKSQMVKVNQLLEQGSRGAPCAYRTESTGYNSSFFCLKAQG